MRLSKHFDEALQYASDTHRLQQRKSTSIPYLGHLLGVASLVIDHGGDEDEAIAALLHDCPEDQGGAPRLEDIRLRFGDRVGTIVEGCSDSLAENPDEKPPWRQRKLDYIRHLTSCNDASIYLVSAADKLHNLRSMLSDYGVFHEDLWSRFNKGAGKLGILQYYGSLVAAYAATDDLRVHRIAIELKHALARLGEVSGSTRELEASLYLA